MIDRKRGFYEKYVKRLLDIICSLLTIIIFCWLYFIIALIVRIKMGSPVIFRQPRPGLINPKTQRERIFYMYKFRTMTDERDSKGNLLPDEQRLPVFGKLLRATSLDELPEMFNILKGDMSVVGPRPQLVRDMVFMDKRIRMRHTARPGLSGLAQINGRNAVSWEQKFEWDLKYIERISFWNDLKIVGKTIRKVFGGGESSEELDITDDYGDVLLKQRLITDEEYRYLQQKAKQIMNGEEDGWHNWFKDRIFTPEQRTGQRAAGSPGQLHE